MSPVAVPTPSRAAVRRLATARLISVTGDVAAHVALAVVLYTGTGSATWVGAALFIAFAVPALVSPVSGALGDRFDRRRVLIASDLLAAACSAAMALVSGPGALLALAFLAAVASAPFLPASGAMVPALTAPDALPWANARIAVARTIGSIAGPVVGGGLVAVAGGPAAFAVNAASFAVSAALVAGVRGDLRPAARAERGDADHRAIEGLHLVLRDPTLRALTLGFVLVDVGNGLALPAEVALAGAFGVGASGYGALVALWGAGGVLGARCAPALLDHRTEPAVLVAAAGALAVAFGTVAAAPWFALALAGLALGGAAMSVAGVGEDVVLQRRVADHVRGRVYAAHVAAVQLSLAAPLLFAGALVDALGPQPVFAVAALAALLGALVLARLVAATYTDRRT
jgi:MFS family permease